MLLWLMNLPEPPAGGDPPPAAFLTGITDTILIPAGGRDITIPKATT